MRVKRFYSVKIKERDCVAAVQISVSLLRSAIIWYVICDVAFPNLFYLFLDQNICFGYTQKNSLNVTVMLTQIKH